MLIKFELVVQNKNKINAKGECSIYLRLTHNRAVRYLFTGYTCQPKNWNEKKNVVKSTDPLHVQKNMGLKAFKSEKENIYQNKMNSEQRQHINLDDYLRLIKAPKNKTSSTDFFMLAQQKIETLKSIDKLGTARYYKETINSIFGFHKSHKLELANINFDWLQKYENYLRKNKCNDGGIAVRMRAIRAIYNEAIKTDTITIAAYPFRQYSVSKLRKVKKLRSITQPDMQRIILLDTGVYRHLELSKDLFLFSYYTGGMNFIDMLQLKITDIIEDGKRIKYTRTKTGAEFNFILTAPVISIIEKYTKAQSITGYVFPLLAIPNPTPQQVYNRKKKLLTKLNKDLKEIGLLCNIDFDLTSYVSRHSFATHLKQNNVSTDIISELLGHSNIKVTETYLSRFPKAITDNALESLIQ